MTEVDITTNPSIIRAEIWFREIKALTYFTSKCRKGLRLFSSTRRNNTFY